MGELASAATVTTLPLPGLAKAMLPLARRAAEFLAQPTGPRVAVLELGGWGVHMPYHVTWAHETEATLPADAAARMRQLALDQFGCLEFQALCEGDQEIALSYWPDLDSIRRWKTHSEHLLAQSLGGPVLCSREAHAERHLGGYRGHVDRTGFPAAGGQQRARQGQPPRHSPSHPHPGTFRAARGPATCDFPQPPTSGCRCPSPRCSKTDRAGARTVTLPRW
mgnify:CR=1 FL=1